MSFLLDNLEPVPLVYPSITPGQTQYTNVLLIDNSVPSRQTFVDSANSSTFPIVYSTMSSKTELLALLQANFASISRIGIVFASSLGNNKMFLDRKPLFVNSEMDPYSENVQFLINLIKEFQVKNLDFLACDTLSYPNYVNYYNLLADQTGVVIGASKDKTGNIKYGGDWVMESTSENIEFVYFTQSIEYYQYLLDNPSWSSGYQGDCGYLTFDGSYMYFPNYYTNTIIQTNLDGTINNSSWASSNQGISSPEACIVYDGYLYVSNYVNSTISKISLVDPAGQDTVPSWATATQGLKTPSGIVISDGYLYVSNNDNSTISKISLVDPASQDTVPSWATSDQGLYTPNGMVISDGYLYVSNFQIGTISKISLVDPTMDYISSWVTATQGLKLSLGMAINGNYLYVSNYGTDTISKILLTDPTHDYILSWATPAQGLFGPNGMAISDNYLYVYNYGNGTISQISLIPSPPPPITCFLEGSKILTDKGYLPIEVLRKGDLVKTVKHDFVPINMIGKKEILHHANKQERIKDQLYRCSKAEFPELLEDLVITGCHSILVDKFSSSEQRERVKEVNGDAYVTDNKYRLPACTDERTAVYEKSGLHTIYHLALDHDDYYMNYGIYANGLLVESCSKWSLKEKSDMVLIE